MRFWPQRGAEPFLSRAEPRRRGRVREKTAFSNLLSSRFAPERIERGREAAASGGDATREGNGSHRGPPWGRRAHIRDPPPPKMEPNQTPVPDEACSSDRGRRRGGPAEPFGRTIRNSAGPPSPSAFVARARTTDGALLRTAFRIRLSSAGPFLEWPIAGDAVLYARRKPHRRKRAQNRVRMAIVGNPSRRFRSERMDPRSRMAFKRKLQPTEVVLIVFFSRHISNPPPPASIEPKPRFDGSCYPAKDGPFAKDLLAVLANASASDGRDSPSHRRMISPQTRRSELRVPHLARPFRSPVLDQR